MYTEESLIVNLILKDVNAIKFAYKKYGPALYGVIHNHSPEKADQVFIKSFTRIVNTIDKYDSVKSRLFTWMYHIVMDEMKN